MMVVVWYVVEVGGILIGYNICVVFNLVVNQINSVNFVWREIIGFFIFVVVWFVDVSFVVI